MSELKYPQDSHEWASDKGIRRKCQKHNIEYDPHIGCKKCIEEERERKKQSEEKKRKLSAIFDNVIWPDKSEVKEMGTKGRKNVKKSKQKKEKKEKKK